MSLPTDHKARKGVPIYSGVLMYFPDAIAAVAECSRVGNDQHNPGQPLHWARDKSQDHADCAVRHLMEAGSIDSDKVRHSAKAAWRCLALLQLELEAAARASAGAAGGAIDLHHRCFNHQGGPLCQVCGGDIPPSAPGGS